jgi:hypothetical protein
MKHVALTLDVTNKNARIYTTETVEKALPAIREQIKQGRMFVTAEEPLTRTVPLNDVVATVNDVYIEGDRLIVDFEFLKIPFANAVQEELNRGNIALRTSGCGNCEWNGENGTKRAWFVKDYELLCFCFTYSPS